MGVEVLLCLPGPGKGISGRVCTPAGLPSTASAPCLWVMLLLRERCCNSQKLWDMVAATDSYSDHCFKMLNVSKKKWLQGQVREITHWFLAPCYGGRMRLMTDLLPLFPMAEALSPPVSISVPTPPL